MKSVKNAVKRILLFFISKLPLQKKVVFCNFNGRGFGDDPKYITMELLRRNTSAQLVWLTKAPQEDFPQGVKVARYGSFLAKYHYLTSRVWVLNTKNTDHPVKRKKQYYIQTWHGGIFGLKKVEKAIEHVPEFASYVQLSKRDSLMIDLMYSDNDLVKNDFEKNFWYDGPVIKCGIPRESILINIPKDIPASVRRKYNVPEDAKIVLYAPTFRADMSTDAYKWDYNRVLNEIEKKFGTRVIMFLRMHPNVNLNDDFFTETDRIRNVCSYPDMQELLATVDFCISDYSSCYFELACLRSKPVFLIGLDFEHFTKNERSFHLPLEKIPFKICKTEDELCADIRDFSDEGYREKLDAFGRLIGLEEDGLGAQNLADIIDSKLQ